MSNEEAINDLSVLAERMDSKSNEIYVADISLESVETAIEALKEQDAGRWIPVTERLPDREGAYIVTVGDIFGNGYVTREWFYGNEWSYSYVVAWMDVKAYEGSEEDAEKL